MQVDIAQHVERLLFEHETVIIPTFGGFTATRSPASLDAVGGTIAPPSKTLAFNENLTVDDGILAHDIAHTHGISEDEARELLSSFVESTREALDQREIVTLPGIGRLYKNYAQKVQFLPDTTNFNTDSFGLPKIQFASVPRGSSDAAETKPASPAPATATTSAQEVQTATQTAPVAQAADVAEQQVQTIQKQATQAVQAAPEAASVTREVQQPFLTPARIAAGGVLAAALGLALFFFYNNEPTPSTSTTEQTAPPPTLPGPVGDVLAANGAQEAASTPVEKDDDATGDITEDADEYESKKMEAEAQLNNAKTPTKKQSASKKIPAGMRRCVLIVGTFRERANATKVLAKLDAAGLDTYHRRSKGHQVGIEFYYKNYKEVQEKIKQVQSVTGEDNIWIKKK